MSKKKKKQKDVQISVPKDWEPLFEWIPWHHDKQQECKAALRAYWEVIFCGGNGSGKTHILYWLTSAFSLGVAPYQNKLGMQPPLSIKVLVTDYHCQENTV
jgi:polynucleotide 5'-kinase involved in rRNA processing